MENLSIEARIMSFRSLIRVAFAVGKVCVQRRKDYCHHTSPIPVLHDLADIPMSDWKLLR